MDNSGMTHPKPPLLSAAVPIPRCPECQRYLDVDEVALWAANTWCFDPQTDRYVPGRSDGEWEHHLVCRNERCRRSGQTIDEEEIGLETELVDLLLP